MLLCGCTTASMDQNIEYNDQACKRPGSRHRHHAQHLCVTKEAETSPFSVRKAALQPIRFVLAIMNFMSQPKSLMCGWFCGMLNISIDTMPLMKYDSMTFFLSVKAPHCIRPSQCNLCLDLRPVQI